MDLTGLYVQKAEFIRFCANRIIKIYGCGKLFDDLISAGAIAFLEQTPLYDEAQGAKLTTFLYPHIMGAMKREVERNFNLSKREFQKHSKDGTLSLFQNISLYDADNGNEMNISEFLVSPEQSVEQYIYIQICLEHLKTAFHSLSYKEREILGGFFGAFGHREQTLAEIGEMFNMRKNAAQKAKDKALEKLRDICLSGDLGYWASVRAAIRAAARDICYEPLPHDPVQILAEKVASCLENAQTEKLSVKEAEKKIRVLALRAVLEQLEFKLPEAALRTFIRLTQSENDPLAAMERIAAVLLEEVYYILKYKARYREQRYSRRFRQL